MTGPGSPALDPGPRALLLDIEGTTTPIEFVRATLFPFARERLAAFLGEHVADPAVSADLDSLRAEHAREAAAEQPPPWHDGDRLASATAYLLWLMDRDRKSTALKALQGRIWEAGYRTGSLRGPVYDDVPPALIRWKQEGRECCIFSSGSVLAQRLLFGHSTAGDLTPLLAAFFDTTTGPKHEAGSYRRVAAARGREPREWLFLSDVALELDAAREAGMATDLVVRPGRPEPVSPSHPVIRSFDALFSSRSA
ncbi:MAG: acireductone synthase [Vicinamibacteria bacterium]